MTPEGKRRIAVIIGSRSDLKQCARGLNLLRREHREGRINFLGVRVCSAHRNPDAVDVFIQWLIDNHVDCAVAGAGGSNHLTAILDTRLRNKYHDVHTAVIGVAFSGKTSRKTQEAIFSITGVPGFQGIFDENQHVGSEGFYNACFDAIGKEKPAITLAAPKPSEHLSVEEAYAAARNSSIPPNARYDDLIADMEEAGLFHEYTGKVRETFSYYEFSELLYFYQTDRISIFDIVLNALVPGKGAVLTAVTAKFLSTTLADMPNHLVAYGSNIDRYLPESLRGRRDLQEHMLVVRKTTPLKVEAIVRGNLTGSGLKDYRNNGGVVCGIQLSEGLVDGSELPELIFTPSTKAELGDHDVNISFEKACEIVGKEDMEKVRFTALEAYRMVRYNMRTLGIVVADTKLEFGIDKHGNFMLIDEAFTSDSSRFWPVEGMKTAMAEGKTPPSFDKQPVRIAGEAAGVKKDPTWVPSSELIAQTTANYLKMAEITFGKSLEKFQHEDMGIEVYR